MSDEETARDARIREIGAQFPAGDLAYLVKRIAALEADNAELHFVRETAEDEIIAGREYLNIAGREIDALKAENARMRAVVADVATLHAVIGNGYCPLCGGVRTQSHHPRTGSLILGDDYDHAADCTVITARAILASASGNDTTNEPEGKE